MKSAIFLGKLHIYFLELTFIELDEVRELLSLILKNNLRIMRTNHKIDMIDQLLKPKRARLTFAITPANKPLNKYEQFSHNFWSICEILMQIISPFCH